MTGFETFRVLLVRWIEETRLFPEKNLHVDLILNPHAGAFRHQHRCNALVAELTKALEQRGPLHHLNEHREVRVLTWVTEYPGHEKAILAHLQTSDPCGPGEQRLVVTAGGDGTSRGALISALTLSAEVRAGLLFFRLPLGTGNDGADCRDWSTALEVLKGSAQSLEIRSLPVIEVHTQGHPVHFSFNIASVGLDAFVVHMTNRLKSWFPGNSYSLMVDVASFFYEAFVQVVASTLELTAQGKTVVRWDDRFLLAALGTTGNRTYGAGKRVLPDDDNFCLAGKKNLFTKLAYRKPFYEGTHRGLSGITLARGDALKVLSPVRVPIQMDGEVLWLNPENFPLTMNIVDHGLHVLTLAGGFHEKNGITESIGFDGGGTRPPGDAPK